ncbi:hypothetical protein D1872_241940 [compost metagenome]
MKDLLKIFFSVHSCRKSYQLFSFSAETIKNIGLRVSSFISGILFNISLEGTDSFTAFIIKPVSIKSLIYVEIVRWYFVTFSFKKDVSRNPSI